MDTIILIFLILTFILSSNHILYPNETQTPPATTIEKTIDNNETNSSNTIAEYAKKN